MVLPPPASAPFSLSLPLPPSRSLSLAPFFPSRFHLLLPFSSTANSRALTELFGTLTLSLFVVRFFFSLRTRIFLSPPSLLLSLFHESEKSKAWRSILEKKGERKWKKMQGDAYERGEKRKKRKKSTRRTVRQRMRTRLVHAHSRARVHNDTRTHTHTHTPPTRFLLSLASSRSSLSLPPSLSPLRRAANSPNSCA